MDPIKNDNDLVDALDELKHQIKEGVRVGPMCRAFNEVLNKFIAQWHLDGNPHVFAEWPQRIAMKCTSCGRVEEMKRVVSASEASMYLCPCGCTHDLTGNYVELEQEDDDEGWGGPFGH